MDPDQKRWERSLQKSGQPPVRRKGKGYELLIRCRMASASLSKMGQTFILRTGFGSKAI
jgi:hypothetical protein